MNGRLASILQERISQFVYVDKISGLVRVLTKMREGKEVTIPVGIGVVDDIQCDDSTMRDMIPDSSYRCMVYFEDRGLVPVKHRTRGTSYNSRIRLVCWINTAKFDGDTSAGDKIMQQFIGSLPGGFYNDGPFIGLRHTVESVPERGRALFSQYTYKIDQQFLMWPYDAFAIDIVTSMRIRPGCEDEVVENDVDCWTPPVTRRRRFPYEFPREELQDPVTGLTAAQLGVDCLDCSGGGAACPYDGIIMLDGVQVGTFGPFDPCVDNTLNVVLV